MTKMCSLAMRLANPIPWSFKASSKILKANEALLAGEASSPRFEALKTAPAYVLAIPTLSAANPSLKARRKESSMLFNAA
jgi:hypothetical protein